MIELREDQLRALDDEAQPATVVDPRTGQRYRLIREEVYRLVQGTLKPLSRGWEDDPEMDVYEQYRKQP